jgi:hypothetical protein
MSNKGKWDLARQVATVVGALFQVLAPAIVPIGAIAKETPSLVIPADYAFAIWGPIFLLCLAYATYQALPANGQNPLLQRVGWFLAGAFFLNGLWEVLVPLRQPVVLQAILAGIFACLAVGYVRLVRSDSSVWNRVDRWLVALPLGLLFGWITAANVVSFNDTLVELGLLGSGVGGALAGAFLLCVSRCVVHTQKDGAGRRVVKDGAFLFAARPSYPLSGLPSPVSGPMALFLGPALPAFFSLARVVSAPGFS